MWRESTRSVKCRDAHEQAWAKGEVMRKLTVNNFMSFDGIVQAPSYPGEDTSGWQPGWRSWRERFRNDFRRTVESGSVV
jgi:hypothetical protein